MHAGVTRSVDLFARNMTRSWRHTHTLGMQRYSGPTVRFVSRFMAHGNGSVSIFKYIILVLTCSRLFALSISNKPTTTTHTILNVKKAQMKLNHNIYYTKGTNSSTISNIVKCNKLMWNVNMNINQLKQLVSHTLEENSYKYTIKE